MNKIISIDQAVSVSKKLRDEGKSVVVAGGCFDILHIGHIAFIRQAKQQGDVLFLLLESDESIQKTKGVDRPINNQKTRAEMLEALQDTDYIILLSQLENREYDDIIRAIHPTVIATTEGDEQRSHKERQAQLIGAQVVNVIPRVTDQSTSNVAKLLSKEL